MYRAQTQASASAPQRGGTEQQNHSMVLREGCGFTLQESFLASPMEAIIFRAYPACNEQGVEDSEHIDPEGTPQSPATTLLGRWCCPGMELVVGVGQQRLTFLSGNRTCDDGTKIADNWSPAKIVWNKLRMKFEEATWLKARNMPTDIPPEWQAWLRRPAMFNRKPGDVMLVQCDISWYRSQAILDAQGQPGWLNKAVLVIPTSAVKTFASQVGTNAMPGSPLTLQSSMMGDFISAQAGACLRLGCAMTQATDDNGQPIPQNHGGKRQTENKAYSLARMPQPTPLSNPAGLWTPWEKILWEPTVEEQLELLASTFDWKAVDYALRGSDYAEKIPEAHRGCSAAMMPALSKDELTASLQQGHGGYAPPTAAPPASGSLPAPGAMPPPAAPLPPVHTGGAQAPAGNGFTPHHPPAAPAPGAPPAMSNTPPGAPPPMAPPQAPPAAPPQAPPPQAPMAPTNVSMSLPDDPGAPPAVPNPGYDAMPPDADIPPWGDDSDQVVPPPSGANMPAPGHENPEAYQQQLDQIRQQQQK